MTTYTLPSGLASVDKIDGGFEGNMPVTGSKRNDALIEAMSQLYKAQELIAGLQAENERLKSENKSLDRKLLQYQDDYFEAKEQGE